MRVCRGFLALGKLPLRRCSLRLCARRPRRFVLREDSGSPVGMLEAVVAKHDEDSRSIWPASAREAWESMSSYAVSFKTAKGLLVGTANCDEFTHERLALAAPLCSRPLDGKA
jgi:hypothetical protein